MRVEKLEEKFVEGRWYNTTEAYKTMGIGRTTFYRKVCEGKVKWSLRRNFPGKWFKGGDLNRFYNATIG